MLRKLLLAVALALISTIGLGAGTAQADDGTTGYSCHATAFSPYFAWPLIYNTLDIECHQVILATDWPVAAQVDDYLYDATHGAWLHLQSYAFQKYFTPTSNYYQSQQYLWEQTWTTPCPDGRAIYWAHYAEVRIIYHRKLSGNPGTNYYGPVIPVWSANNPFACT